jgi:RNA polymerase sigma factor (sigma-70 family)
MLKSPMTDLVCALRRNVLRREVTELSDSDLLGRFLARRDEAAFEALVQRHGAMVLGVCLRVVGQAQDAEDAFQATFLVLARKAASVQPPAAVGRWLYGVAYRTALKARAAAAKRRAKERQAPSPGAPHAQDCGVEIRAVLDQELSRLPEDYRAAVVLCDLEGLTRREAALHLGWPEGTVAGRLARARDLLASRLTRRGVALAAGGLATVLADEIASAAPSLAMVRAGLQAALTSQTPPAVVALVNSVLHAGFTNRLLSAALLIVVLGLGGAGVWFHSANAAGDPIAENPPAEQEPPEIINPAIEAQAKKRGTTFRAPGSGTFEVALSADGKLLARGDWDHGVDLWDVASGKKLHTLKGHTATIFRLAFSPDGKTLASIATDWGPGQENAAPGQMKLWDVATGKERVTLKGLPGLGLCLAFSSDGKTVATSSANDLGRGRFEDTVKLWDVDTGKEKLELKQGKGIVAFSLAFSSDGKTLAMGTGRGIMDITPSPVILWDVSTGKERARTLPTHKNSITWVGFSPDGKTLASACGGNGVDKDESGKRPAGEIKLWDVDTAKERATILTRMVGPLQFFSLAFTADGKTLISAMWSGDEMKNEGGLAVDHWELATGKSRATFWAPQSNDMERSAGTKAGAPFTALSADGKTVAWGGTEGKDEKITGTAHVWEVGSLAASAPKLSGESEKIDPNGAKKADEHKKQEAVAEPWTPLFNGKDLKGWSVEGDNSEAWRVEGDELLVDAAKGGRRYTWLLTEKAYSEFLLRFEYQLSEKGTSGVAVWATRYEKVHPEGPNHLQVKLMDDPNYPNIRWPTGAIFWNVDGGSHIGPDRNAKLEPVGSWNRMEIEARAQSLRISVNGVEVHSIGPDKLAAESGAYAGLKRCTGHVGFGKGVGVARFRKIEVKELKSAAEPQDKKLNANVKEPTKQKVKEPAPKQSADGWVALFNRKDLTGWKTHPVAPGDWRVEDGILIGRGPKVSHLYTERSDYEDFQFLIEAKINAGGNSGQAFRKQFSAKIGGDGYEAQIDSSSHKAKTGSLYIHTSPAVAIAQVLVPVDTWFTQLVIVRGNHIVILVNGQKTVDFIDKNNNYARGHLALQVYDPATVVQFRRIDMKDLKPALPEPDKRSLDKAKDATVNPAAENAAVKAIKTLGGRIKVDADQPGQPVVAVDFSSTPIGDTDLTLLEAFSRLQALNLFGTKVTAPGLVALKDLRCLNTLTLDHREGHGLNMDAAVKALRKIGQLHALVQAEGRDGKRPADPAEVVLFNGMGGLGNGHGLPTELTDAGLKELTVFTNLEALDLNRLPTITDAGMKEIAGLTSLQTLNLNLTKVTDAGVKELAGLRNLQTLSLIGTPVTDAAMKHVNKLANLQMLGLSLTGVTAAGLAELRNLKRLHTLILTDPIPGGGRQRAITDAKLKTLREIGLLHALDVATAKDGKRPAAPAEVVKLDLVYAQVTDAGLAELREFKNLESLELAGTKVTDAGLAELKQLPRLQTLSLWGTAVTDASLTRLKDLPRLQTLGLVKTKVTDAGLKDLPGFATLKSLDVSYTAVTAAGVKQLEEARPKLIVTFR